MHPTQHQTAKTSTGFEPALEVPTKPLQSLSINGVDPDRSDQRVPGVDLSQAASDAVTHSKGHALALSERFQPSGAAQSSSNNNPQAAAALSPAGATNISGMFKAGGASPVGNAEKSQRVGRVGVESLGGLAWQLQGSDAEVEHQIYVAVFQLKAMIRDSRCAAMVSFPAGMACLTHTHIAEPS